MTRDEASRILGNRLLNLHDDLAKLVNTLGQSPEVAEHVPDRALLTAAAWVDYGEPPAELTGSGATVVREECIRRALQARPFAAYLDQGPIVAGLHRLLDHS